MNVDPFQVDIIELKGAFINSSTLNGVMSIFSRVVFAAGRLL